jgi:hypothetical protein
MIPETPKHRSVTGGYFDVTFYENGDIAAKCKRCKQTDFYAIDEIGNDIYYFIDRHFVSCPPEGESNVDNDNRG